MRNLNRWCKGRVLPIRLVVKGILPNLAGACSTSRQLHLGGSQEISERIKNRRWLDAYRHPKKFGKSVAAVYGLDDAQDFASVKAELEQQSPDELKHALEQGGLVSLIESAPALKEWLVQLEVFLDGLYRDVDGVVEQIDFNDESATAFVFLLKVQMVCCYVHHTHPTVLFRQARNGNLDALESLLRIDKTITSDWLIGEQWNQIINGPNQAVRERMRRAFDGGPLSRLTAKRAKIRALAIITVIADASGHRLATDDLLELLDATSRDFDGRRFDEDISRNPNTFRKAINRARQDFAAVDPQMQLLEHLAQTVVR
jgi:hypothetical protein